jgi:hypothetical protein
LKKYVQRKQPKFNWLQNPKQKNGDNLDNVRRETSRLLRTNKKFWKEVICLLSLYYLKMSFALKPAFAPT